ncbi:XrtA/PEP-CTERM system TPR-repeat protein PrsT [Pseudaquabacterium rugosum]|uniref:XrtA/PEP-CTERM system TPR-repeat protein PrsT n=1 Tax=Pseudaquabacterium rugosum TaxID=2984194 RepID=A0ABU9B3C9_9BURK
MAVKRCKGGVSPRSAWWVLVLAASLAGCGASRTPEQVVAEARAQTEAGKTDEALVTLKSFLSEQIDTPSVRLQLARTMIRIGDWSGAVTELDKLEQGAYERDQVVPLLAEALLHVGQASKVLERHATTRLSDPAAQAELQITLASALLQAGQVDKAEALLQQAMTARPDAARGLVVQARLLATRQQWDAALERLEQARARDPKLVDGWQLRTDILARGKNDLPAAIESARQVVSLQPTLAFGYAALIDLQVRAGDIAAARQTHQKMSEQAPRDLRTPLAGAQLAYLGQDHARARAAIELVLKAAPEHPTALVLDGAIKLAQGAHRLAEASFAKAARVAPGLTVARQQQAQALLLLGEWNKAQGVLKPLLAERPDDPVSASLMAQSLTQQGETTQAQVWYEKALKANPDDAAVRTALAMARIARGEVEPGMVDLSRVASKDPGDTADLALINARMARGQWEPALQAVRALSAKLPKRAYPRELAARILMARNDVKDARVELEAALALEPRFFPAVFRLALLDVRDKQPEAARKRLQQYVDADPQHVEARMALVDLGISQRSPRETIETQLKDLLRAEPSYVPARVKLIQLYMAAKQPKQAVTAAQEALVVVPDRPDLTDLLGAAHLAAGEHSQAVSVYTRLVSLQPGNPRHYLRLSEAQVAQGDKAAGLATLRRALDTAALDVEVNHRYAVLARALKQDDKALATARELQRRAPGSPGGHLLEAEMLGLAGQWPAAADVLRNGIAKAPQGARGLSIRLIEALVRQGKVDQADAVAQGWLARHPGDVDLSQAVGSLLLSVRADARAEAYFAQIIKRRPDDASALNNLAWLLAVQNKPAALDYASRALKLQPESVPVLDTYAQALAAAGRLPDAVKQAEDVVRRQPDAAGLHLTLAKLQARAGQSDAARKSSEEALRLAQTDELRNEVRKFQSGLKGSP